MTKRPNSYNRIPIFRGFRPFRPLEPETEPALPAEAIDPSLRPEEQGTIKRYLHYADTLINSSETTSPEASGSDETPADNEDVREVSLLGSRRSTDKKKKAA